MNKVIAVIPARYNSTRFPGKMMEILGNRTIITTTYQNVLETGLFDEVFIVEKIYRFWILPQVVNKYCRIDNYHLSNLGHVFLGLFFNFSNASPISF